MTEPEASDVPASRRGQYRTENREMPVLFDFDHSRPFGTATFDTSTGDFLMRIHRRTKLWRMLAGADERGVVVAVAIRPFDPATDEVDEGNKDE